MRRTGHATASGLTLLTVGVLTAQLQAEEATTNPAVSQVDIEAKYRAWRQYVDAQMKARPTSQRLRSDYYPVELVYDNEPFRDLVALGVSALPYLIPKMKEDGDVGWVVGRITKWRIHIERRGDSPRDYVWSLTDFPEVTSENGPPGPPTGRRIYAYWWQTGRMKVPGILDRLYREWQERGNAGDDSGAKDRYQRMVDLGVVALPCMVAKVQAGDGRLIPAIAELSDKAVAKDATPEAVQTWWARKKPELRVLLEADPTSQPAR
jgi:hypothetical protein